MADKDKKVNEDVPATPAAETITTKSAAMSGILAAISAMSHDEMMKWFPDAMALAGDVSDSAAAQNQASIQMKPSDATGKAMKEEVEHLFEGESLTADAKNKLSTLIEHAVDLRTQIESQRLEEEFQTKLVEEVAKVQEELVEKVDQYATYAAEQWVEKNEVAVESAIKVERAERLLEGIAGLMKDCGLEVPDDKVDALEAAEARAQELEAKLNEHVEEVVGLRNEVKARDALLIFKEVSEGLTQIEADKFKKLIEDVEVDADPDELRQKITIIKEAHFKGSKKQPNSGINEEQLLTEEGEPEKKTPVSEDPRIQKYAEAISRASNRYTRGPYTG